MTNEDETERERREQIEYERERLSDVQSAILFLEELRGQSRQYVERMIRSRLEWLLLREKEIKRNLKELGEDPDDSDQ